MNKTDEERLKEFTEAMDKINRKILYDNASEIADIPFQIEELTELINKYLKPLYTNRSVAILWDVENILPSSKSLFTEGFLEYVEQFGRITVAQAFADWNKPNVKKIAKTLSQNRFELVHTPDAGKNSSDFSLVSLGIEMTFKYPNIDSFVLVTSDSDFRPLVRSLVRNGKQVHIVCDTKKTLEDLLVLADTFVDYRELIPGEEEVIVEDLESEEEHKENLIKSETKEVETPEDLSESDKMKLIQNAFSLLSESAEQLEKEEKVADLSRTKVKFKMLNPNFKEKKLGFKKWSIFVDSAEKAGFVDIKRKGSETILVSKSSSKGKELSEQNKLFEQVIKILKELDQNKKPEFHRFGRVAEKLYEDYDLKKLKNLGFKQLRSLMQALETRNLVETKAEGMDHFVKRCE